MKKIFIICSLVVLYSCGNDDKKQETKTSIPAINKNKKEQTPEDVVMQEWLKGKVWTAEESMAPMRLMKLKADGECDFFNGPAGAWTIISKELVLTRLTEWPVEKIDDKTFHLYVKPTDTWYIYKHTEDLP